MKNKIIKLGDTNSDIFPGPGFLNNTNILRVGESVGSFYGLRQLGTWGSSEATEAAKYGKIPGDLKFLDKNTDGKINNADREIMGKGIPDGFGSLSNTFRYKNIDFTIELQYSYGASALNLTRHSAEDRTGQANSYSTVLNAWTPANQNTNIEQTRPSWLSVDGYFTNITSAKVEDASFIRGKNLMLGYTFPTPLVSKYRLSKVRLYMSAQNFFVATKYTGYDPEVTTFGNAFAQGIQFFDYPKPKTWLFGLNVSF